MCLDLGETKSTGALYAADGHVIAEAGGPAGAVSLGVDISLATIRTIWGRVGQGFDSAQTDLVIGLAGIGLRDRVATLQTALSDFRSVRCVSDGYGALLAATDGNSGSLIVVGTGVVAMRLNPDGTTLTASGWGFPAGDLGGGAWIGLQAVAGLTRFLDGLAGSAPMSFSLATQLMQITGSTAPAIMAWLTNGKAGDYARLAPIIGAAEEPFAQQIITNATAEIGLVVDALCATTAELVHLSGGLGPVLHEPLARARPRYNWQLTPADPLHGLYLMASGQAPNESLIHRPRLSDPDYPACSARMNIGPPRQRGKP